MTAKEALDRLVVSITDKDYQFFNPTSDYHKVKQSLEVLEILKKKKVNILKFKICLSSKYPLANYNKGKYHFALTQEEFNKIKEWLNE